MQSSILQFFAALFHRLAYWFNESVTGRLFNRLSAFLARVFRGSLLGRLLAAPQDGRFFRSSRLHAVLTWPIRLCRALAQKLDAPVKRMLDTSGLVWLLHNWYYVSIRVYGVVLCAFTLTYTALRMVLRRPGTVTLAVLFALFCISVLCILINRSVKSLFKGSRIATAFGSLFCDIKKDSDSKLFLKDPEFFFARPLSGIAIGVVLAAAAAVLPLKMFILLIGGLLYVFLSVASLSFGVFTVIIAAPVLPTMALAGCCLLCGFSLLLRLVTCKDFELRSVPLAGYIAIFVLTLVLGTLNSFTFVKSTQILFLHLAFILFYIVCVQALDTEKKWYAALVSFVLMAGLVALYGVYQNFAGVSSTASWVDSQMFTGIKTRVYSTFDNPNVLGEYLVLLLPLTLAVMAKSKTDGQRTTYAGLLLVMAACMVFTWSRGAWLGVFLATALFLLIMDKRWALCAVVGLFMLPFLLGSGSAVAERLLSVGNTNDTSTAYRVSIWCASVNMIRDFWLSGIGPGSEAFSMIYPKYALAGANFALHSHNLFLQLWVELGICGITAFLALILAFVRQCFALCVYQKRGRAAGAVCLALCAGTLGYMFQGLTDNVWYNYKMVLIFWIVLAFAGTASSFAAPQPAQNGGERV